MHKLKVLFAVALLTVTSAYSDTDISAIVDYYDFDATLKVPQVVNNSTSQGKRSYVTQHVVGRMAIDYLEDGSILFDFIDLYNKNFKVNGGKVTYTAYVNEEKVYPRLNYIGNNKTDKFQTATIAFYMEALPSYAKGEAGEDNSFLLTFAGKGTTSTALAKGCRLPKTFGGNCAGTQGCGCAAYTHKSPTRRASATGPTDMVDDVAATWGTWKAKFVKSISRKSMVVTIY